MVVRWLERADDLFMQTKKVRALKDFAEIQLAASRIPAMRQDEERELHEWQVRTLIAHGLVELVDPISDIEVVKDFWNEKNQDSLSNLDQSFYPEIKTMLKALFEETYKDKTRYARYSKALRDVRNLLEIRSRKLVDQATSGQDISLDNMQPEERLFFHSLAKSVRAWRSYLNGLMEVRK